MRQTSCLKSTLSTPLKVLLLASALTSGPCAAGDFFLAADLGYADPDTGGYDNTQSSRVAGGYQFEHFGVELAWLDLGESDYEPLNDSSIAVEGYTAQVYFRHMFNGVLGINLGGGIFDWDADAKLFGQDAGNDSDTSAYYEVRLVTEFSDTVGAYIGTRYLPDVSGSAFTNTAAGIKISF